MVKYSRRRNKKNNRRTSRKMNGGMDPNLDLNQNPNLDLNQNPNLDLNQNPNIGLNQIPIQEQPMDIDELDLSGISMVDSLEDEQLPQNNEFLDSVNGNDTSFDFSNSSIGSIHGDEENFIDIPGNFDSPNISFANTTKETNNNMSIGSFGSQGGKKRNSTTKKRKSNKRRSNKKRSNKKRTYKKRSNKRQKGGNYGFTTQEETSPIAYLDNIEISQANMPKA